MCSGYPKKNADVCIPETPPPPNVCKRLQLGTPSPPKSCGRPLWTAPYDKLTTTFRKYFPGIGNLGLYVILAHIFIATPIYRPFMVTFKLGRVPSAMHIFLEQKRNWL